jgi:carbonic anhydrase
MNEIMQNLLEGNKRFLSGLTIPKVVDKRLALITGQNPIAIVLCCSDSRVPTEMVFDADFGELFVVRIAGNIVAPSIVGSIEYAITKFSIKNIIVLGHSDCGAILTTLDCIINNKILLSDNLKDIVERISPSIIEIAKCDDINIDNKKLMATRSNILASVNQLRHASKILENKITCNDISIYGAIYDISTGLITIL